MNTPQDHGHDHSHAAIEERDEAIEFTVLETAIRELSIGKGLFSAEDHRRFMEWYDQVGHTGGARVVARAWVDPAFQRAAAGRRGRRLQGDGHRLAASRPGSARRATIPILIVCENTPQVSQCDRVHPCARAIRGPCSACRRPGTSGRQLSPADGALAAPGAGRVRHCICRPTSRCASHDFQPEDAASWCCRCGPAGTEGWSEERLAAIITRDCNDRRRPARHRLDHLVNTLGDRPTGLTRSGRSRSEQRMLP